jgi:poly-beta-1,6-N-acetyl-D-glucosamine N-deacetylase
MQYTLRNILAACKANIYIRFGYVNRAQKLIKQNKYILSIYFHDPSEEVFRNSVSWLIKENYTFLSLDDLLLIKNNKKEVPVNGVVITVDDGWRDNYKNIVPIANAYKVPVAIFITTQPVLKGDRFWWSYIKMAIKNKFNTISVANLKRMSNKERLRFVDDVRHKVTTQREAMTIQELQEISNSKFITIGSHTVTHPILPNCTNDELRFEIIESKKIIEQIISKPINSFSFPNGD